MDRHERREDSCGSRYDPYFYAGALVNRGW